MKNPRLGALLGPCDWFPEVMMVGDNRKYNIALVTLLCEGATGELPGTNNLAGVALEVRHGMPRCG